MTRFQPLEGQNVEKGGKVTIWVSNGPQPDLVTVPLLTGFTLEDVLRQIESAGLTVRSVDGFHSDYAEGIVFWQSRRYGEQVDRGTPIDLWVSTGPAETAPPVTEPPASDPPATEDPIPVETDVVVPTVELPIVVDLSGYEGTVKLEVRVGGVGYDSYWVDADMNTSKTVYVRASGTPLVEIYINDVLVDSYHMEFT